MKDHATHVVVVDRQKETQELIDRCLTLNGYQVSAAADPAGLSDLLDRHPPDLIVLDMQTIQDGDSSWLRRNLAANRRPVIVLITGVADLRQHGGLAFDPDDYLAKPLDPGELLARIRAALNRMQGRAEKNPRCSYAMRFQRWALADGQRTLRAEDGRETQLSRCEAALLRAFLAKPGEILTREQLLELTVGRDADVFDRNVDNLVRRLRKKIEIDPGSPLIIRTHWRRGYRFAAEVRRGPSLPPEQGSFEFAPTSH